MNTISILSDRHVLTQIKSDFKNFISKKQCFELMKSCSRVRSFDPVSTLHCFLFQCLEGSSCKLALASFNASRVRIGLRTVAMNTSSYCRARKKLCETTLLNLVKETGKETEDKCKEWRWKNRAVKLVDGTTLTMSDTEKSQLEYPQSERQKVGLGWPMIRLVGVFDHASGAILDFETGTYAGKGQGEPSLLRRMISRFSIGDILILDRFFSGFFLNYDLIENGVDVVVRMKDAAGQMYIKGQRKDVEINVTRPPRCRYNGSKEYDLYEPELPMRVIKSEVKRKGYRATVLYLMTSLLDKKKYSRQEIEEIYSERWGVELDFRNFKKTLKADHLSCKTPDMVRKELYTKMLAYNLVRRIISNTCEIYKKGKPRKYSFKTTLGVFLVFAKNFGVKGFYQTLELISDQILNSKYRWEARALKRRRNGFPLLTKCRNEAKNESWGYSRRSLLDGPLKMKAA